MLISLRAFCEHSFQVTRSSGHRVNYEQAIRCTNENPCLEHIGAYRTVRFVRL